ncbi:MAG: 2OG-Fe(II) oxygenase [Hyphomicrobiaceae bacterium]
MGLLNFDKLASAAVQTEPFEYLIVPGFLSPQNLSRVVGDYPNLKGGSYPLEEVAMTQVLGELIEELDGPEFERLVSDKFGVSLAGKPKMYSLRGYCRASDGKIHTDSKDKIITVLLYLNDNWKSREGGKLRLLRSGTDLNAFAAEVPPDNGTLLVFKRSESSWHGHEPFEGVRRSIQMNWMVSEGKRGFHKLRHQISARLKKLVAA